MNQPSAVKLRAAKKYRILQILLAVARTGALAAPPTLRQLRAYVTERSKTGRATIGRVFCAVRHNVQVHTGVRLFTVVWKFGGSKGRPEGHAYSARVIWTALDHKLEEWLAVNVKRILKTGGSRGSQQRCAKHARA